MRALHLLPHNDCDVGISVEVVRVNDQRDTGWPVSRLNVYGAL
jgi:hypothetical protein